MSRILKGGPCAPQFGKVRFRLPRRLGVFAGARGGGIFLKDAQKDIAMFHLCSQKKKMFAINSCHALARNSDLL